MKVNSARKLFFGLLQRLIHDFFYLKKKMSHSVISPETALSISSDIFDYFFSIIVSIKFGQTIV